MNSTKDIKDLKNFGLTLGVAFCLFLGLLLPALTSVRYHTWPWAIGLSLIVLGLLSPAWLKPLYRPWMKFSEVLGAVNSRLILGIVFFLVLVPIAFLRRLVDRKFDKTKNIQLKWDSAATTYRVPALERDVGLMMEKPFL